MKTYCKPLCFVALLLIVIFASCTKEQGPEFTLRRSFDDNCFVTEEGSLLRTRAGADKISYIGSKLFMVDVSILELDTLEKIVSFGVCWSPGATPVYTTGLYVEQYNLIDAPDTILVTTKDNLKEETEYNIRSFIVVDTMRGREGGNGRIIAYNPLITKVTTATPQNQWKQIDDPGVALYDAVSFIFNGKGYIASGDFGVEGSDVTNKIWLYDPNTESGGWQTAGEFSGDKRYRAIAFSTGNNVYMGLGSNGMGTTGEFMLNDIHTFNGNTWTKFEDYPFPSKLENAVGFGIANKGYVGLGIFGTQEQKTFYEFDILKGWTEIGFAGAERSNAIGFAVAGYGFVGLGKNVNDNTLTTTYYNDIYRLNPNNNTWQKLPQFPGEGREDAIGFGFPVTDQLGTVVSYRIFVGLGFNQTTGYLKDLWEYDPQQGTEGAWTRQNSFIGEARAAAIVLQFEDRAFIGTGIGEDNAKFEDFYQYLP